MANIRDSLSHTKWLCKYHIVFTPKYRRKAIYGQYKESIGQILRQLCNYKGVEIVEGHLMPDHVHMLVSIPPKYSVSQFMGYLKAGQTHYNRFCIEKWRKGVKRLAKTLVLCCRESGKRI